MTKANVTHIVGATSKIPFPTSRAHGTYPELDNDIMFDAQPKDGSKRYLVKETFFSNLREARIQVIKDKGLNYDVPTLCEKTRNGQYLRDGVVVRKKDLTPEELASVRMPRRIRSDKKVIGNADQLPQKHYRDPEAMPHDYEVRIGDVSIGCSGIEALENVIVLARKHKQ